MSNGVRTQHPDYKRFAPRWKRARDVIAGTDAIHLASETYLPKLKNEDNLDYVARIMRSDFFNATWRTIDALNGMAFRKPPVVEVPTALEPLLEDVTLSGVEMNDLAKDIVEEILSVGRLGILVDHPPKPGEETALTIDTAQKLGLRPTLKLYTTENIINWKFARINNAWVLAQVVLHEQALVPKDEFSSDAVDQYRVLDLDEAGQYRQRVFEVHDEKDLLVEGPIYPLMNGKALDFIPFALVGACGRSDEIDEPPLIDLIDKNVAHYQVNSDYRHSLHFCGLPTLFLAGYRPDKDGQNIYVGGSSAIIATDPAAKGSFIEMQGQGIKPIEDALNRIEQHMAILGARMIADESKQVETLGATQIKRQGENSVLAKIVQSVGEAIEWALGVFAEWAGVQASKIRYEINRDFMPAMMDGREMMGLVQALQAGGISHREFFDLMQRGDVINGDATFEQHQEEIRSQGPTAIPAPAKPTLESGQPL